MSIEIESELINRFSVIYPQRGAKKWFFNEILRLFLEVHDPTRVRQDMQDAVNAILGTHNEEE